MPAGPNNVPAPPNPLTSLKASFSAQSGKLTRAIRNFDKAKGQAHTPISLAQIEKYLNSAEIAFGKLEELSFAIIDLDPNLLDEYNAKVQTDSDRLRDLAKDVGDLLSAATAAPAAPIAAPPPIAPAGAQQVKVIHDLKPGKLSLDNTPAELHLWSEAFKAYFSASKLDRLAPKDQHAFVFACLDADLHRRIMHRVLPATPVFDPNDGDSVLKFLEEIFLHRYLLVQRRFDFFQYPHSAGQMASSWIAELRMRGDIADLGDLTTDQLYAYRIITGVHDADLKDELLKLEDPSFKDVEAATLLYEAKLSTKAKTSVHRVQNFSRAQSRSNSQCGNRPSSSTYAPGKASGAKPRRCGRCNRPGHDGQSCTWSSSVECHQCGRRGHIASACRNAAAARAVTEGHVEDARLDGEDFSQDGASVRTVDANNKPTPRISLTFRQGKKSFSFLALPDSGATRTIVAQALVDTHGLQLDESKEIILAANGERLHCAGSLKLVVSFDDNLEATIDALVTPDIPTDILLSWHDMKALKILHEKFPIPVIRALSASSSVLNKLFAFYSDVVSDTLGSRCLEGPPMKIYLRNDVEIRPFKIYTTKQIPLHLQTEADAAVQRALDDGVICRESEPTDWCCRGGFVPKPNGKLRLITDFIPLNKYILRPVHPFPSAIDIIQSVLPSSTVFAVLDCTMGYFQVPLDEQSSKLTTFLLPQGRFRYRRAPMGLSASSDKFCRRSDEAIAGLPGVHKLVDDILIQAPTIHDLYERIANLLERCRLHGLTLSKKKAQFALSPEDPPVKFAGFLISARGVQPDPDKLSALKHFPVPESVTELRSFLGLANQLGFFIPDLAHLTSKMRLLLKKGVAFVWCSDLNKDFQNVKDALSSKLVVQPFDPQLKTQLLTDASRVGLGFALLQITTDGTPRLIQCGSRSLIPAETRYATIELECLAVVYAMTKCKFYLRGLPSFQLITDHRPLVGLFDKSLTDVENPRIQRFRERVAPFNFNVIWIAGKANNIADALSRAPHFPPDNDEPAIICTIQIEDARVESMKLAARDDLAYQAIIQAILQGGRLARLPTEHPAHLYANVWTRLSVSNGLIVLDGCRLVPPTKRRPDVLKKLHLPHAGIVRTRKQAQQLYFWPGMNNDIKLLVQKCSVCQMLQPSQSPEPRMHSKGAFPMQDVSLDPFEYGGRHYLLMADRFSGYPWVGNLRDQCTGTLLKLILSWFLDNGFPVSIRTDGGPQFRSEFDSFCDKYGIRHGKSSPLYPEANGHAEANVKSVKHLHIKCTTAQEDFRLALMEFRNTPQDDGYSPAQLYFARRQRTVLPCSSQHLASQVNLPRGSDAREAAYQSKNASAESRTRVLASLSIGQAILMQDVKTKRWIERGKILSKTSTGKSYWIQLENKRVLWRNRRYLRPISSLVTSSASDSASIPAKRSGPVLDVSKRKLRDTTKKNYREARSYIRK